MPKLTATECERAIRRLTAEDPQTMVANAFGVHSSTVSHLWIWFQTTGTPWDARWGHTQFFLGWNLSGRCAWTLGCLKIKEHYVKTTWNKLMKISAVRFENEMWNFVIKLTSCSNYVSFVGLYWTALTHWNIPLPTEVSGHTVVKKLSFSSQRLLHFFRC